MLKDSKDKNMKNLIERGYEFRNFNGFEIRTKDTEELFFMNMMELNIKK